jgi:UDP-N-acetylmuramoyl-L-alanyl-D-glutamate--2,6-diaminopimelate ligase
MTFNDPLLTRPIAEVLAIFDIAADDQHNDLKLADLQISNIVLDSREVNEHSLFIAQAGTQQDGREYIRDAIERGAKLVLANTDKTEMHGEIDAMGEALIIHFFELPKQSGFICSAFHRHISSKLQTIAVTGTNGKTSVTHLCAQLSAACEEAAGTIGTMGVSLYTKESQHTGRKLAETINTTPDVASLHHFTHLVKHHGAQRICIEASSHGLDQNRLSGFKVDTAVFTNLTQDHLDYHETLEAYAKAKRKLLKQDSLRCVVLNADDTESQQWAAELPEHLSVCLCSIKASDKASLFAEFSSHPHHYKYCIAKTLRFTPNGCAFEIESSWGEASISLPLIGMFNIANLLSALTALLMQGLNFEQLVSAIAHLRGIPGRMEVFESRKHANIIVDYAHTPDALQQALMAARQHALGNLTVIFGCGGDRDNSKREQMGRIAEKWADEIVLTQDNSRSESPENIVADIMQGMQGKSNLKIELDRKTAIREAFLNSQNDALVLVAGKGHEEYLELNSVREYYNEREYVNQLTLELKG